MNHLYTIQLQHGKWYVGITKNYTHRMDQHIVGEGAAWCRQHGPSISCSDIGQFGETARWEETKKTLSLMIEYGINNVRGAEYCQLADFGVADAKRMSYAAAHHLQAINREAVEKKFEQSCFPSSRVEASSPLCQKKMGISAHSAKTSGGSLQVAASPLKRAASALSNSNSNDLYGRLCMIRDSCASSKNIPTYAVFKNETLREMADALPTTNDEFLSIKGVGQQKCMEYGSLFMSEIIKCKVQFCESCSKEIDVNPLKPSCLDCYRAKRHRK